MAGSKFKTIDTTSGAPKKFVQLSGILMTQIED